MKKKPKQETRFEYKGYPCVVLFQPHGFRCGYVGLPMGTKYYGYHYNSIPIECHGGLTYSREYLYGEPDERTWWIGFDCGHYNDGYDLDKAREYFGNSDVYKILEGYNEFIWARTLEYVIEECKGIVDQLVK